MIRGGQKKYINIDDLSNDFDDIPCRDNENLFILSVTLSNNKTYLVDVKKDVEPEILAMKFCKDNKLDKGIAKELTLLLR